MTRLASRVAVLEQAEEQARSDQPYWWELPCEEWHLGRIGITHEEAIALLDELAAADEGNPE